MEIVIFDYPVTIELLFESKGKFFFGVLLDYSVVILDCIICVTGSKFFVYSSGYYSLSPYQIVCIEKTAKYIQENLEDLT